PRIHESLHDLGERFHLNFLSPHTALKRSEGDVMRHTPELIVRDILHAIRRRSRVVRGPTSKMRSAHRNDCRGMPMSSGWSAVPAQRVSCLRSHVEKTLRAAIISGQLKPEDMMTMPTLAAVFVVSLIPSP